MVRTQTPNTEKKGISMIELVMDIILIKYQKQIKK
ncbi:MAG: hypothetical protein RL108_589 [Bacteroidota bacterium]|jgi:hypothetical protein